MTVKGVSSPFTFCSEAHEAIYVFSNRTYIRGSAQGGGWLWTRVGPDPLSVSSTALLPLFTQFANNDQDYDDHDDQNDDNDGDDDYVDDKPSTFPHLATLLERTKIREYGPP